MSASADLDEVAAAIGRFPDDAVRGAVTALRAAVQPRLKRDTGGDFKLSGLEPSNSKLRVTTRVTGTVLVEGTVKAGPKQMRGPWRWLDDGTRPREQGAGRHPGTAGKGTWSTPITQALPDVEKGIARDFQAVIR